MTFKHKLSCRLALLKDRGLGALAALLAVATVFSCEQPLPVTDPIVAVERVVISPKAVTLQPDQWANFTAVSLMAGGDTSSVGVVWTATGGVIADTGTVGRLHYGRYKNASSGDHKLIARSSPGWRADTASITVAAAAPVASVQVAPTSASVQVGQTVQLTATPKDASGTPLGGRVVTWISSNSSVATVSPSGLVAGSGVGSATITATSEGVSGTSAITVTALPPPPPPPPVPVASVEVTPTSASVQVGQTVQLTATPKDANGNPLAGRVVTWTSSSAPVATVNSSGRVTGVAAGAATITATSEGKSGTSGITVMSVPVASVDVTPSPASVQVGSTVQLTATPKDANGNPLSGRVVTWTSSNTSVATVSSSGLVSGLVAGSATITAMSEGKSGTSAITVTTLPPPPPVPVASVDVTPASASVQVGGTVQLTATPKDANGNPLSGRVVTWVSSNTAVATVSTSGLVTGKLAGTATITATSEGQSGTSALTVTQVPVASVEVTPASATVEQNKTVQLTATPKDANGNPLSNRVVTWASSNTAVATVSASGLVTGKAAGSATITATSEGKSGSAAITVTPAPVASVTVTPASATVQVGSTVQLTATPKDASGNPLSGRVVTWSSSDNSIATVNGSGLVTGAAAGLATITATSEGKSGTSLITVTVPPPPGTGVVFVGAGDISTCGNSNDEATAKLLDNIPGTVFTAGDNAYPDGTASNFSQCYDPTWGRHKARTRPSPGNHDYHTSGATGYYNYFGANAGPSGRGYYSYDLGDWHIISLNSNISMSAGSAQEQWLRADLAASTKKCTLAHWHHPRFSSGSHGSSTAPKPLWQALYDFNADVVVVGHDHNYQRFAPQTPDGVADPVRGIRQFVAGMGGSSHYSFGTPIANTEAYNINTYGVLKLTLSASSYTWQFIPVAGATYTDSGSGTCH